jgi:hypothetical protein
MRIRDGKKSDPESGINIPEPQHWYFLNLEVDLQNTPELTGNEDNTPGLAAEVHQPPHLLPKILNILGHLLMLVIFKGKKTLRSHSAASSVGDAHVFGPPRSGSISQRYGSGSGSFPILINVLSGLK